MNKNYMLLVANNAGWSTVYNKTTLLYIRMSYDSKPVHKVHIKNYLSNKISMLIFYILFWKCYMDL